MGQVGCRKCANLRPLQSIKNHPLVGYRRQGPSLKKRRGNGETKLFFQIANTTWLKRNVAPNFPSLFQGGGILRGKIGWLTFETLCPTYQVLPLL